MSSGNYPSVKEQQELCANARIVQNLWGPVLHIPGSSNTSSRKRSGARTEQKLCDSLSWIALTFIRERTGRDVAVCMNPTKPIELLISDNQGSKQRPGDKEVMDFLVSTTALALKASIKEKNNYTPQTNNIYKTTIESMVRLDWDRIGRKLEKISSVLKYHRPLNGLQKYLETHLEAWLAHRKECGMPTEMFTALEKGSNPSIPATNGDQNDRLLKSSLSGLFELSGRIASMSKSDREKSVKKDYQTIIQHCAYVESSDFLNNFINSDSLDPSSRYPFIKLRRRIRNLTKYNTGAYLFLKDGIKYIQQYVGEGGDPNKILKFTFIGDSSGLNMKPQQITWPKVPTVPNVPGARFWTENAMFTAHVHCEVVMIYYIVKQRPSLRVIGTSTFTCIACRMFVNAVTGLGTYGWRLPPDSVKDQYDWLMISTEPSNPMKVCFETVYNGVKDRAQIFLEAQRLSRGSS